MKLNTFRKYHHSARPVRVSRRVEFGNEIYERTPLEPVECHIRILNKLGWAELYLPDRLREDTEWLRWDMLMSPSGELVFPLLADGETGKDHTTFDVTPIIDGWGNIFEWKYTITQNPSGN